MDFGQSNTCRFVGRVARGFSGGGHESTGHSRRPPLKRWGTPARLTMFTMLPVALVTLGVLTGCTAALQAPAGYVKLREPFPYEFKAVSARGGVIALKTRPNEDAAADLAFWSQAVEHQKVDLDGLHLAGRESIKSTAGREGVLFNFETGEGQGKVTYLIALYVTPQRIFTVEAGGPAEIVAQDMEKLRTAILSVRVQ
jgi:hypothetical protein